MGQYILRRILWMLPVILGISFILFSILEITPGDPAQIILGERAAPEQIEKLREEMGLNRPFIARYISYVTRAAQGDFGLSYRTRLPVFTEILDRFPITLTLTVGSVLLMTLVGVPAGILSAVKQYSTLDNLTMIAALILNSMPGFWLGVMLMLLFALNLGWLPSTGTGSWKHLVLPCVTLAAGMMASLIRMTRSNMLEVLRQDYIRTALAKGAGEGRVIRNHALRNALLPVITIIGLDFSALLGGTLIIEQIFAVPGLGALIIAAVRSKDVPLVMASILFVALLGGFINLAVDILYVYVDPRLKSHFIKAER
jgi:peptide/nickel transport system permease protein